MALNGTINGTCYSYNGSSTNKYEYKIEWSATQNASANTSTITAQSFVRSTSSSISTQSNNWVSKINGSQVWAGSWTVSGSWVSMGSRSWTVNHNADGTCTTNINGELTNSINFQDVYVIKKASASANVTLNAIPRASSFTLNRTSATIGSDAITVNITKASSSFTHTVIYKFGSITADQASKTSATSVTFTPSLSDCAQLPNSTSGTATVVVDTYNGSTKVGTASKTLTLNVPSSVVPTIGSIGITGNNLLSNVYVAGKSTVTAKINSASGVHGSTIKSYNISGAGISSTASSATSGALTAGTHTITGKVTDSRGRTASKSTNITVHSYYAPSVSINLYRCDSSGNKTDSGTYAKVTITPDIVNIGNANVNAKQYRVEWKKASSSTWTVLKDWATLSSYNTAFTCDLAGGWDNTTTYNVRVSIKDSYSTVSATGTIGTISCIMNIEQKGIGIGKPYEQGALDVGGQLHTANGIYSGSSVFIKTDPNSNVRFGYHADTTDTFIANSANNWLRLKTDKTMTYAGYKVYTSFEKPTASEIGALPLSGGTITGTLKVNGNSKDISLGTGGSDGYLYNSKANAYWQFRDNGQFGIPNHLVFQGSSERRVSLEGTNKGLYFNSSSFGFYDWANSKSLLRIDLANYEIRSDSGYFVTGNSRMITSKASTGYISWSNSTDWKYSLFCQTNTSNNAAASSLTNGAPAMKLYSGSGGGLWLFPAGDTQGGMVVTKGTGWATYGDVTCNKTYTMSDMRLKKDIQPLDNPSTQIKMLSLNEEETTGSVALDIIKKAKVYSYMHTYDDDSLNSSFGLMAQDLPVELTKQYVPREASNLSLVEEGEEDFTGTTMRTKKERNAQKEDIAVDVYGVASIAWEGVRVLLERIELLEKELQAIKGL